MEVRFGLKMIRQRIFQLALEECLNGLVVLVVNVGSIGGRHYSEFAPV